MSHVSPDRTALSVHYGHNATVGLSIGGEVVCLLSEERINRLKNSTGFPYQALAYVRDTWLGGSFDSLDAVVLNDELLYGYEYLCRRGFDAHVFQDYYCNTRKDDLDKLIERERPRLRDLVRRKGDEPFEPKPRAEAPRVDRAEAFAHIAREGGFPAERISLLDHHTAHALSPLYFVDINRRYLLLTIDGEGDGISASVGIWDNGQHKIIDVTPREHSLGYLYSAVTAHMGMKPNEHEFKVMGMAPYARPDLAERLAGTLGTLLWFEDGAFRSSRSMLKPEDFLIRNLLYERFDTICGAVQLHTEELLLAWVTHWVKTTGIQDLLLSGGVMMNVKAAKRISELPGLNSVFVMPSSGDESLVVGGLFHANRTLLGVEPKRMTDLYLGRTFDDDAVAACLDETAAAERYDIERLDEDAMAEAVAEALASGLVVARCCGREEWGARALGNRSILCDASSLGNIDRINEKIKKRDFWMPFTPSVLAEDLDEYVTKPLDMFAPYMCITFDSTAKAQRELPAALHPRDRTVRPQEVTAAYNPGYHAILRAYKRRTGVSAVLNTSFNLHGEPNVSSPQDAIRTMDDSGLDALVLGSYWLRKRGHAAAPS
ncbi:MAG: hypothetical protein O2894_04310 [Planctomycetota bacterium]|nr:hypothetical protein [Planctomycetota bacterium]